MDQRPAIASSPCLACVVGLVAASTAFVRAAYPQGAGYPALLLLGATLISALLDLTALAVGSEGKTNSIALLTMYALVQLSTVVGFGLTLALCGRQPAAIGSACLCLMLVLAFEVSALVILAGVLPLLPPALGVLMTGAVLTVPSVCACGFLFVAATLPIAARARRSKVAGLEERRPARALLGA